MNDTTMNDTVTNHENVTASDKRDDAIIMSASPRPWRVNGHTIEANDPEGLWIQNGKTGWGVVANLPSCPKSRMSKKNRETWDAIVEANAALIVDAVNYYDATVDKQLTALLNERDRLRDIVRRLANMAETTLPDAMENRRGFTSGRVEFEREAYALIREARAAVTDEASDDHNA